MPKILRILNRLNVGGPTYNVACLSKYLRAGYETEVLAGFKEPEEGSSEYVLKELGIIYEFVPHMHRKISPLKDLKAFFFIRKKIKEYGPEIVHTHAAKAGVLGRLAAHFSVRRPRVIVHTFHGNVFDGYFSPLKTRIFLAVERYLASKSDAIIAISEQQKYELVHRYKIAPGNKIYVIKLGFDLLRFTENMKKKRTDFRSHYGLTDDVTAITITGRLTAIKNHSLFIRAICILKVRSKGAPIKAFIIGDGELMETIIDEALSLGLTVCRNGSNKFDADLIFTSWRKDIDQVNAGSDIVVLTSINEGTPVSIIEAMASEKAVVCTDVGGVRDIIQDGISGLIAEQSAEDIASKLQRLVSDRNLREAMGKNGRSLVLESYTYKRLIKDVEYLYSKLL